MPVDQVQRRRRAREAETQGPVEHSLPQIQTPWRTATVVLSAVAALQFVVLIVLAVALLAEPVSQRVSRAAEQRVLAPVAKKPIAKGPAPIGSPKLTRSATAVIILNGNGRRGAAAVTAERVRRIGYTIGSVGNAPSTDYARSIVMYRSGKAAEGRRLAKDLGIKVVGPLDGMKPSQLLGAHAAVIIGG
ncbi:MAG: LytR C-terminal domain-containing protein [Actinobacteria bacterium]|nr:LytR C-terminal domain-containing protein [Actinomycetota bacterium]